MQFDKPWMNAYASIIIDISLSFFFPYRCKALLESSSDSTGNALLFLTDVIFPRFPDSLAGSLAENIPTDCGHCAKINNP